MKSYIIIAFCQLSILASGQTNKFTNDNYKEDFNFFWKSVNDEYAYFHKKNTDWDKIKSVYSPLIANVTNRDQFVSVLERALYEIYDHHAILNTNTDSSFRLVPSGTDIWAQYVNGKPVVIELRKGFGAESVGVLPGMEIIAINDVPAEKAISNHLPQCLRTPDVEAKNFVLRQLLAGDHIHNRKLTLKYNNETRDYYPDIDGMKLEHIQHADKVEIKMFGKTGYIKINDCLYDNDLIPAFDSAMQLMKNTSSLVLDLRETPSGGNTTVARAILGWFVNKEHFFQKHEYYGEEKSFGIKHIWEEMVSPREKKYYNKPLVILCDHWTASLGEALVIGFDALKRPNTAVIGTPLARLYGAVYSYEMPNTKIHFSFPAERLYHVNGAPREKYTPAILIDLLKENSAKQQDIFLNKAFSYLKMKE